MSGSSATTGTTVVSTVGNGSTSLPVFTPCGWSGKTCTPRRARGAKESDRSFSLKTQREQKSRVRSDSFVPRFTEIPVNMPPFATRSESSGGRRF